MISLPLCFGLWLISLSFVNNIVDINKDLVEVFATTLVCCVELAVDPWD